MFYYGIKLLKIINGVLFVEKMLFLFKCAATHYIIMALDKLTDSRI